MGIDMVLSILRIVFHNEDRRIVTPHRPRARQRDRYQRRKLAEWVSQRAFRQCGRWGDTVVRIEVVLWRCLDLSQIHQTREEIRRPEAGQGIQLRNPDTEDPDDPVAPLWSDGRSLTGGLPTATGLVRREDWIAWSLAPSGRCVDFFHTHLDIVFILLYLR